jgi:hypothetical protein
MSDENGTPRGEPGDPLPARKSAQPEPENAPATPPAKPRVPGVPFRVGFDPRRGRGPKPGSGGRPKDEFVVRMQELAKSNIPEEILRDLDPVLMGRLQESHPLVWMQFERLRLEAWREASDRGHGKPTIPVAVDTDAASRARLRGLSGEELVARYLEIIKTQDSDSEEPSEGPGLLEDGGDDAAE